MSRQLLLIRHTEVAKFWRGRCYGSSDAGLSRAGAAHARDIAPRIAAWQPDIVIHSDRRRTRYLAELIARLAGVDIVADSSWRERDFGTWEARTWGSIYRATGNAMDGMIDAPDSFRPGGGETTNDLADRIVGARHRLPNRRIAVLTHGGPIAVLRRLDLRLPQSALPTLIPGYGEGCELRCGG